MAGSVEAPAAGSLLARLADAPMHRLQVIAVAISIALNALDGFDVLAVTFAAPGIAREWALNGKALGVAISAGLVGMSIGSLFVAPFGDKRGRRPLVLLCLAIMTVGMGLCAVARGLTELCLWRLVAGIGIGGMVATINAVAAEFSNARHRALCVAMMTVGYPVGGLLGGFAAAALVESHSWRAIFVFGALVTAAFLPICLLGLPESPDHLARQRDPRSVRALERLLARLGIAGDAVAPTVAADRAPGGVAELLGPTWRRLTLLLIGAYCLHMLVFYFFTGWLPKMMSDLGYATPDAIRTSAVMSVGGVLGGTAFGWIAPRLGLGRMVTAAMVGSAVMLGLFAAVSGLVALQATAFVIGMCVFSGIVGLYSLLAFSFPARLRVTGTGLAIGVGRGGAVLGPIIGGALIDIGLHAGTIVAIVGLCSPAAALLLLLVRRALAPQTSSGQ